MDLSQASPVSTTPFPQTAGQSRSLSWLQPAGQQLSPLVQRVMGVASQRAVQAILSPAKAYCLHSPGGGQSPGHAPVLPSRIDGSQLSLGPSTTPLPHTGLQSLSRLWLPAVGQHPSPAMYRLMVVNWQRALQVSFESNVSVVQVLPSSQLCGHEPRIP